MANIKLHSVKSELIIVCVFLLLILFSIFYNPVVRSLAKSSGDCAVVKNFLQQASCYTDMALRNKDATVCNLIKYGAAGVVCYEKVAMAKNDITVCENIHDTGFSKGSCYNQFSRQPSAVNIGVCEKIPKDSYKEVCYRNVISLLPKGVDHCVALDSKKEKSSCYFGEAMLYQDNVSCKKIDNQLETESLMVSYSGEVIPKVNYQEKCYEYVSDMNRIK